MSFCSHPTKRELSVPWKNHSQGKTIGVQTASTGATFVEKYLKDVVQVRACKTTEQHDLDLAAGCVDLVMASMAYLTPSAAKPSNEEMTVTGPRSELKAMFDKGNRCCHGRRAIKTLSQNGSASTLHRSD